MSDIFISYASEDQARVAPLAAALSGQKWSVWWDRSINAGRSFDEVIEAELGAARVVIVAWSRASVQSRWVRAEAQEGLNHNKLIPVFLEEITPPLIFRSIQAVSLVDWDGRETSRDFTRLVADIGCLLDPADPHSDPGKQDPGALLTAIRNRLMLNHGSAQLERAAYELQAYLLEHPSDPEALQLRDRVDQSLRSESDKTVLRPRAPGAHFGFLKWAGSAAGVLLAVGIAGYLHLQQGDDMTASVTPTAKPLTSATRPAMSVFRDSLPDGSAGPEMVVIPAGEFRMGNLQEDDRSNERPVHRVHIAAAFAIGKYEISYAEYLHFATATGRTPPHDEGWGRGRRPVIDVSWEDATAYAHWLTEQTGEPYHLPSEAEWEYAARAGSATSYWWGHDIRQDAKVWANCNSCGSQWDGNQTAPVGSFVPNHYGLYDTAGNVAEWVQDCYVDNYRGAFEDGTAQVQDNCERRVVRNGGWNSKPEKTGSAARAWDKPLNRSNGTGFRIARALESPP